MRAYTFTNVAQYVVALRAATSDGTWASGREIAAAWVNEHGTVVPPEIVGRWGRALQVGITDGRVVSRREGRAVVYAPADGVDALRAHTGSDLMRVETAVARAVERHGGAVSLEGIEDEIASDPALAMKTNATPIASRVVRLAEQGRIRRVQGPQLDAAGRWYYTTLAGASRIAPVMEFSLDRRVRAIRAIWRAGDGRPFTTRAIAGFSEERDSLAITEDTVYGWTNALQHLERKGWLCQIKHKPSDWHARWVIADEWEALPEDERERRLLDALGRTIEAPGGRDEEEAERESRSSRSTDAMATLSPALRIDVGQASRAQDIRTLAQLAIRRRVEGITCPSERGHLAARPLTLVELAKTRQQHRRLLPARHALINAVHEATRVRADMRRSALVHLGTVRNTSYFACNDTREGRAYVDFQSARADADLVWFQRMAADLERERGMSTTPVNPLPPNILLARAAALTTEYVSVVRRLKSALEEAPLTPREKEDTLQIVKTVEECLHVTERAVEGLIDVESANEARTAGAVLRDARAATFVLPARSTWQDIREAEVQCRGLVDYEMASPRAFWARFPNAVRVYRVNEHACAMPAPLTTKTAAVAAHEPTAILDGAYTLNIGGGVAEDLRAKGPRQSRGRKARTVLDRVGFGMWVGRRFGGEMLSGIASQAHFTLGELRDPAVLLLALKETSARTSNTTLCAALMFFDDIATRDALVEFLWRSLDDDAEVASMQTKDGTHANDSVNRPPPSLPMSSHPFVRRASPTAVATAAYGLRGVHAEDLLSRCARVRRTSSTRSRHDPRSHSRVY